MRVARPAPRQRRLPLEIAQGPSAAASATPLASATPGPSTPPRPTPLATSRAVISAIESIESDALSVVATIGGHQYLAWLRPTKNGQLSGTFRLPIPPPATSGTLELEQVWRTVAEVYRSPTRDPWATLDTWDLRLDSLLAVSGDDHVVLDQTVPARPDARDVSLLINTGYRIVVRAQTGRRRSVVTVEVGVGAGPSAGQGYSLTGIRP